MKYRMNEAEIEIWRKESRDRLEMANCKNTNILVYGLGWRRKKDTRKEINKKEMKDDDNDKNKEGSF